MLLNKRGLLYDQTPAQTLLPVMLFLHFCSTIQSFKCNSLEDPFKSFLKSYKNFPEIDTLKLTVDRFRRKV